MFNPYQNSWQDVSGGRPPPPLPPGPPPSNYIPPPPPPGEESSQSHPQPSAGQALFTLPPGVSLPSSNNQQFNQWGGVLHPNGPSIWNTPFHSTGGVNNLNNNHFNPTGGNYPNPFLPHNYPTQSQFQTHRQQTPRFRPQRSTAPTGSWSYSNTGWKYQEHRGQGNSGRRSPPRARGGSGSYTGQRRRSPSPRRSSRLKESQSRGSNNNRRRSPSPRRNSRWSPERSARRNNSPPRPQPQQKRQNAAPNPNTTHSAGAGPSHSSSGQQMTMRDIPVKDRQAYGPRSPPLTSLPVKKPYQPSRHRLKKPRNIQQWKSFLQTQRKQNVPWNTNKPSNSVTQIPAPKPVTKVQQTPKPKPVPKVPTPSSNSNVTFKKTTKTKALPHVLDSDPFEKGSLEDPRDSKFRVALEGVAKRMNDVDYGPPTPTQIGSLIRNLVDASLGLHDSFYLDLIGKALKTNVRHWRPYLWAYVAILHQLKVPGKDVRFSVVRSLFDHILNSGHVKLLDDVGELEVIRNYWGLHLLNDGKLSTNKVVDCTIASVGTKLRSKFNVICSRLTDSGTNVPNYEDFVKKQFQTSSFDQLYPLLICATNYKKGPLFKGALKAPSPTSTSTSLLPPAISPPITASVALAPITYINISNNSSKTVSNTGITVNTSKSRSHLPLSIPATATRTDVVLKGVEYNNLHAAAPKPVPAKKSKGAFSVINPAQIMTRVLNERANKQPATGENAQPPITSNSIAQTTDTTGKNVPILEVVDISQTKDSEILIISSPKDAPDRLGLPVENDDSWRLRRNLSSSNNRDISVVPVPENQPSAKTSESLSPVDNLFFPSVLRPNSSSARQLPLPSRDHRFPKSVPVAVVVGNRNKSQPISPTSVPNPKTKPAQTTSTSPTTLMPPPPPPRRLTTAEVAKEKIRRSQQTVTTSPISHSHSHPNASPSSTPRSDPTSSSSNPRSTNTLKNNVTQRFQPLSYFVYPEDPNNPSVKKGPKSLQQQQRLREMGINGNIPRSLRLLPDPPSADSDSESASESSKSSTSSDKPSGKSSEPVWDICPEKHDEFLLTVDYTDQEYVDLVLDPKFYAQAIKDVGGLWQVVVYHHKEVIEIT